jgi:hypothetical protein
LYADANKWIAKLDDLKGDYYLKPSPYNQSRGKGGKGLGAKRRSQLTLAEKESKKEEIRNRITYIENNLVKRISGIENELKNAVKFQKVAAKIQQSLINMMNSIVEQNSNLKSY